MAISLADISSDIDFLPPRLILVGTPKAGKSTLASQFPGAIAIPVKGEEGVDEIACPKFPTANSFQDVMDRLELLVEEKHPYKTVFIDSASTLQPLVYKSVCARHGAQTIERVLKGYGKGYAEACEVEWEKLTLILDHLRKHRGVASILVGHVKSKLYNDPQHDPYDQFQWDLQDRAKEQLVRWADAVLFMRHEVFVKKVDSGGFNKDEKKTHAISTGAIKLYTQERGAHPGGGRGAWGRLPYEIEPTWLAFQAAVKQSRANLYPGMELPAELW